MLSVNEGAVAVSTAEGTSFRLPLSTLTAVDDVVRVDAGVTGIDAAEDLVIVAMARGGGGLSPTGGGGTFCYTAPLYVDAGGDGWVGWLSETETLSDF